MSKKFLVLFLIFALIPLSACTKGKNMNEEKKTVSVSEKVKTPKEKSPDTEEIPEVKTEEVSNSETEKIEESADNLPKEDNASKTDADVKKPDESKSECTLSINCKVLCDNPDALKTNVKVPSDGLILSDTKVAFTEGESAFDVLKRITRDKKIHLEFSKTPAFDSYYIEGINNIYEFDGGENSGWLYAINGKFMSESSSTYILKKGDRIDWVYTLDRGRDIGGAYAAGQ